MLHHHIKLNRVIGLSVQIIDDNNCAVHACQVLRKRHTLEFEKKIPDLKSLEALSAHLSEKVPLALNLSGKPVLTKQVERIMEITPLQFSQLFPGANYHDFYVQNFVSGLSSFVSIVRRAEADRWLRQCQMLGYNVVMFSMGPFPVQMILPQLNVYNEVLVFDGHTVVRNSDLSWQSYTYNPAARADFPFKVENEPLGEQLLIAYAAAFQLFFAHFAEVVEARVPGINAAYSNYIFNLNIKTWGIRMLMFFFAALFINLLVFSALESSNRKLSKKVSSTEYGYQEYLEVENTIKTKELQLKSLGWDGGINKAYLISQLAEGLPNEITWNEIAINPIDKAASDTSANASIFTERSIRIKGNANRIVPVNNWLTDIKARSWVGTAQLESYAYNPESGTGEFIVVVKY